MQLIQESQDVQWANFMVLECASSVRFENKRLGYILAGRLFKRDPQALMMCQNLIKKVLEWSVMW